jgi:hypothetical protein
LTSYGTDFTIGAGGAQTGEVILHHTGAVALTGGGLNTNSSDFTSYGTNFLATDNGLIPGTGNVTIDHTGSVTFGGAPLTMSGGTFVSSGTDFTASNGINTNGGAVLLNHTGTVTFRGPGLNTGGGAVTGSAGDLFIQDGGLHTNGEAVTFNCTGNITISGGGLTTNGGAISLSAHRGITADSAIDSSPGSGGTLTLDGNTAAIRLNVAPVVGAGDISLYVDPSSASIPTLSEWGMIIISLMLSGSAIWMIRRRQNA